MTVIAPVKQAVPVELPSGPPKDSGAVSAHPEKKAAPSEQQGFVSPVVRIDARTGLALTIIRDNTDGNEIAQYPSKQALKEYGRAAKTQSASDGSSAKG